MPKGGDVLCSNLFPELIRNNFTGPYCPPRRKEEIM